MAPTIKVNVPPLVSTVSVILLSRGDRPEELRRAVASALTQSGVTVEVIVVGNGWQPQHLPQSVRTVYLPRNIGVGARNQGAALATGEVLFFLDDDAWFSETDTLAKVVAAFTVRPRIGMLQTRIVDPAAESQPRYWVPRLRKGDPARSSTCMYVMEAAVAIRRDAFAAVGGWAPDFGYAHEGIDMAWRIWNAGYVVWYAGDIDTCHPAIFPSRHAEYQRNSARNRVWLARRNLPCPIAVAYLGTWVGVEWARTRERPADWAAWVSGWRIGWRDNPAGRRPISWRAVTEMARHGRPPII